MKYRIAIIVVLMAAITGLVGIYRWSPKEQKQIFTTEPVYTTQSLTTKADAIIVGRFTSPKTYIDNTSGDAVELTDWQVIPVETWKGNVGKVITVTVIGGQSGKSATRVNGAPTIKAGQTTLVYLEYVSSNGKWIPVSLSQGWLAKSNNSDYRDSGGKVYAAKTLKSLIK